MPCPCLLDELRETAHRATGDTHLISAYAQLVAQLDVVARAYDPDANLEASVLLSADERKHLARERVLSLVEKVRVGRLAELATRAQPPKIARVGPVTAGLSNTTGINDWFADGLQGHQFGWQIQRNQFRLAIVLTGPRDAREQLVTDHYIDYFHDFPPKALSGKLTPYQGKKAWLGYEPGMVYRYATLTPRTTWHDLLDLTIWFSNHAYEYASKHSAQI